MCCVLCAWCLNAFDVIIDLPSFTQLAGCLCQLSKCIWWRPTAKNGAFTSAPTHQLLSLPQFKVSQWHENPNLQTNANVSEKCNVDNAYPHSYNGQVGTTNKKSYLVYQTVRSSGFEWKLEVDRISASISVSAPNVDKWALSADIRFRPKAVVSHSVHFRFRQAAVGKLGGCRK